MRPRYKALVVILDGVGDRPCEEFDGATPLENASTPSLDDLAARGLSGQMDPLYCSLPVDTHTGTALLMGLAPQDAMHLSRGPVEAAGVEVPVHNGDVTLRANFATLEPDYGGFRVVDRRAGRIRAGTAELASELANVTLGHGIVGSLSPATEHRAVLHLTGSNLSGRITDSDPGAAANPCRVRTCEPMDADDAEAMLTAEAVNAFLKVAYNRLRDHPVNATRISEGLPPANGIITRGAGKLTDLHNIVTKAGIRTALVAGERTVLGLGALFEFDLIVEPGFTAHVDTDLEGKAAAVERAFESHDLVFLHLKATDICSHDFDPLGKRDFVARADAALKPLFAPNRVVAVTGDHSTDSHSGRHCGDPVPTLLFVPGGRKDLCTHYGETSSMQGGLGRITGHGLLISVINAMGALHNYTPGDAPYFSPD